MFKPDQPTQIIVDYKGKIVESSDPNGLLASMQLEHADTLNQTLACIFPPFNEWPSHLFSGSFFGNAFAENKNQSRYPVNFLVTQGPKENTFLLYLRADATGLEYITESYFEIDNNDALVYINQAAQKLFKIDRVEAQGRKLWDVFPELASSFFRSFRQAHKTRQVQQSDGYYPPQNLFLQFRIFPSTKGLRAFIIDLTSYRHQQSAYETRSNEINAILNNIMEGVVAIDISGNIVTFNQSAEKITGYLAQEVIGKNVSILMSEDHGKQHDQYVNNFFRSKAHRIMNNRREIQIRHKQGHFFPAEIAVTNVTNDDKNLFIASFNDITQQQIQQSEMRLLAKFPDESPEPIFRVTQFGHLNYANKAAQSLLNYWNIDIGDQVPDDLREIITNVYASHRPESLELFVENTYYSFLIAPIDEQAYVNIYGRDITQNVQDEEELLLHRNNLKQLVEHQTESLKSAIKQAEQANKAKSVFLANMSHELRTPLNAIIGYSEILAELATDDNKLDYIQDIGKITNSARYLLNLINDILDLSKIESGHMELSSHEFDLDNLITLINDTIQPMLSKNQNRFKIENRTQHLHIKSDEIRLKQTILNLLSNAIKFTQKGTIELTIDTKTYNDIEHLLLIISDTGIGMTDEQIQKLFKPFSQASNEISIKYGGTGLGLVISKRFCEMMGGDIEVSSTPNKGSKFTIRLPLD